MYISMGLYDTLVVEKLRGRSRSANAKGRLITYRHITL